MKKGLLLISILLFPISCFAIELHSPKYIVYDTKEEKVLFAQGEKENTAIASLTKIMSTIVVLEEDYQPERMILVTNEMLKKVPWDAYKIKLQANHSYTEQDLLVATLMSSAADAVTSLAIDKAGSVEAFVYKMNQKGEEIGLKNTHFTNPIGMDDIDNKATLEDILILLKYALKNETFKQIFTMKQYTLVDGKEIYSSVKMYSERLNLDTTRIKGAKTGATGEAGYALAEIFDSNNHEIISITTGAEQTNDCYHIQDGLAIINYLDENYSDKVLLKKGELLKTIPVVKSTIDHVDIKSKQTIVKYLPNDYNPELWKIVYKIPEVLDYHSKKEIGTIEYYYNEEQLGIDTIILKEEIKPTLLEVLKNNILYIIGGIIGIIGIIILIIKKKKHCKLTK